MLFFSKMVLCLVIFCISACAPSAVEHASTPEQKSEKISKEKIPMIKAKQSWQEVTVKYLNFEGGFYGLVSKSGDKFLPMNLPEKYKIDGTILRVKGQLNNNVMTIQQWGKPFKLLDMELIKIGIGQLSTH